MKKNIEEELLKTGITSYAQLVYNDGNIDADLYFQQYMKFLKGSKLDAQKKYFEVYQQDVESMFKANSKVLKKRDCAIYVFGRNAYIYARAIEENKVCQLDLSGKIKIDGEIVLDPNKLDFITRKTDDWSDFEEDKVVLPNISSTYYNDDDEEN